MDHIYQKVKPFIFYTIEQLQYQQLLSRSKYQVYIYKHIEMGNIFVVKQIPFCPKVIQVYRMLRQINVEGVVSLRGLSIMKLKNKNPTNFRITNQETQRTSTILLFMQKCEMSLYDYVKKRRKERNCFKQTQLHDFLNQMLITLEQMQRKGLSHRDIKPQNILYNQGKYMLCDFDDAIIIENDQDILCKNLNFTTIDYSAPQLLRSIQKIHLNKIIDPFKMDLYSLGLTVLFMCSLGKFIAGQRQQYLSEDNQSHTQFIRKNRKKYVKHNPQFRSYNFMMKMMLEQDEFKRDNFHTILIKLKKPIIQEEFSESTQYKNTVKHLLEDNNRKKIIKKNTKTQKNVLYILLLIFLSMFILLCII